MIINKKSMYCPKKPSPRPVGLQPIRPGVQPVKVQQPVPINQPPRPIKREPLVPDRIIRHDPLVHDESHDIGMVHPLDFFFGDSFIESFFKEATGIFNEANLKELSKTNDVNHEKWTKVDPKTNAVMHYESFSIGPKNSINKKRK